MNHAHKKNTLMELAVEQSPAPIGFLDGTGHIIYWNTKFQDLCLEWALNEQNRNRQLFGAQQEADLFFSEIKKNNTHKKECRIFSKQKQQEILFALHGSIVKDEKNEIIGCLYVLRDITQYKQEEEQLTKFNETLEEEVTKKSKALMLSNQALRKKVEEIQTLNEQLEVTNTLLQENSRLFIHGPVIVFKWLNKKGRPCEYVSPNVEENLWYKPEDFRNQWLYATIVHPDDLQRVSQEVNRAGKANLNNFTHKSYRIKKREGEYIRVIDYTTIIWDKNKEKIESYIWYVIDLSERNDSIQNDVFI